MLRIKSVAEFPKTMSSTFDHYRGMQFVFFVLLLNISNVQTSGSFLSQLEKPGRIVQTFLRQPVDQTAKQGEHVTLPCQVENKRGMLQWTRDGFGLGVERNLTGFDRYHMIGSDEEGKYSKAIFSSTLIDLLNHHKKNSSKFYFAIVQ